MKKIRRMKKTAVQPSAPTTVHHQDDMVTLHHGDALRILRAMPDNSVHAVVTDPPYGLSNTDPKHVTETIVQWAQGNREYVPHARGGFMGKGWDSFVPPVAVWDECFRVLKPGGYLLSFAGSRTADLMGLSIRLAGFDMRDTIMWLYGSGFPKSMDVSKAIDKAAGAEREVVGSKITGNAKQPTSRTGEFADGKHGGQQVVDVTAPATPEAAQWEGWGTALKPAHEPIIMARKPHPGTIANNVLEHGAGGLNIDACRIEGVRTGDPDRFLKTRGFASSTVYAQDEWTQTQSRGVRESTLGRWPANIALDGEAAEILDQQSGDRPTSSPGSVTRKPTATSSSMAGDLGLNGRAEVAYGDTGGASRFFYVAKANKKERPVVDGVAHPTVKPIALMRWLVRMVTPPDGVVLDPFVGSGTTLEAAKIEGIKSIGIDAADEYLPLAVERITRSAVPAAPQRPKKTMRKRSDARTRMAPPSAR